MARFESDAGISWHDAPSIWTVFVGRTGILYHGPVTDAPRRSILCRLGLHAWRTIASGSADEGYVTDQCQRIACSKYRTRYLKRRDHYKIY